MANAIILFTKYDRCFPQFFLKLIKDPSFLSVVNEFDCSSVPFVMSHKRKEKIIFFFG